MRYVYFTFISSTHLTDNIFYTSTDLWLTAIIRYPTFMVSSITPVVSSPEKRIHTHVRPTVIGSGVPNNGVQVERKSNH